MAKVREDVGQAQYLAAVAVARSRSKSPRLGPLVIEILDSATRAGFDWKQRAKYEASLSRLRASSIWKRLEQR